MSVPQTQPSAAATNHGYLSTETRPTAANAVENGSRGVLRGNGTKRPSIVSPESVSLLSANRNYGTNGSISNTASRDSSEPAESDPSPPTWREKLENIWEGNKGLLLVLIAQIFNTVMNTATRILEIEGNDGKGYHPFQVLFARMSITLVFSGLYMWWKNVDQAPFGPKNMRWLLLIRGFGGFFGVFGMYYSLLYLPLSDATVLSFLSPTITCIACYIFLREPFTRTQQIAGVISLIGVVLVARPATLFSSPSAEPPPASGDPSGTPSTLLVSALAKISSSASSDPYHDTDPAHRLLAIFFALLGVCGASCAYTTLRIIGTSTHPLVSVTYFSGACCLISVLSFLPLPPPFPSVPFALPNAPLDWALLILLGVAGFLMQFLLSMGLQGTGSKKASGPKKSSKGNAATAMVYTSMVFAVFSDAVIFGTLPDAWGWGGVAAIVGSAIVVATGGRLFGKKTSDEQKDEVAKKDEEVGLLSGEFDGQENQRQMAREEQAVSGLH